MQTDVLTYGQLEYLLEELGYHLLRPNEEPRVFENSEYDAVSVLLAASPNEIARPHHLVTLRKVSIEKGIVDNATFNALLAKARCHEPFPAASCS